MTRRRLPLRMRLAALFSTVFLAAGAVFLVVNFALIDPPEPDGDSGLGDAVTGTMVVSIVGVAGGWVLSGPALAPLRSMAATARRVSAANLRERIALDGPEDELKELADTIDDLFARLERSFDHERRFVANASHELRTPLSVTRSALELGACRRDATADELRAVIGQALAATARSEALVDDLLLLARSERLEAAERDEIDLADVVTEVTADASGTAADGVHVALALHPAPVRGVAGLVDRLVANVIDNAIKHNVAGGRVDVRLDVVAGATADGGVAAVAAPDRWVRLQVANTCRPVTSGDAADLFEPFTRGPLSADGARVDGHGLGLSIVRAVVDGHGGTVAAAYRDGGACFELTVELPLADAPAAGPHARPTAGTRQR